jgi:hypothetical protein
MTNLIASIKSRLTNLAKKEKQTYQLILIRYFTERLIYRLSISDFKNHFCLKGGALLYAFEQETSRPTMDLDLLIRLCCPCQVLKLWHTLSKRLLLRNLKP